MAININGHPSDDELLVPHHDFPHFNPNLLAGPDPHDKYRSLETSGSSLTTTAHVQLRIISSPYTTPQPFLVGRLSPAKEPHVAQKLQGHLCGAYWAVVLENVHYQSVPEALFAEFLPVCGELQEFDVSGALDRV